MTDQPCPKCGYPGRFCRCVKGAGGDLVSKEAVLAVVERQMQCCCDGGDRHDVSPAQRAFMVEQFAAVVREIRALPAAQGEAEKLRAMLKNAMGHLDTPIGRRKLGIDTNEEWLMEARAAHNREGDSEG